MAYYLFPPDGEPAAIAPSLGGTGSGEPGNPTVLPLDVLRRFHFTFLIRHPRRAMPSYYKCTIPPQSDITGFSELLLNETGYEELARLFDMLVSQNIIDLDHVTVIDADDLLDNPEQTIRQFCARVGLEFDPCMLVWDEEDRKYATQLFAKWNGWHDDVLSSSRLNGRSHAQKTSTVESENKEWLEKYGPEGQKRIREAVDANIPYYDYLKKFCMCIQND
ncbi:hypothetical protein CDD82_6882 [Ophiocordyceps australis]|uniref:Sulfotransferase domain-containing protein n=1 Tax=Ophiocordyceps australis TaxID=1399860 RepID=A0A2C5YQ20_9HYPO|nr:hypothetical protein CDD82_6882 [Ophiocordyceps australis]